MHKIILRGIVITLLSVFLFVVFKSIHNFLDTPTTEVKQASSKKVKQTSNKKIKQASKKKVLTEIEKSRVLNSYFVKLTSRYKTDMVYLSIGCKRDDEKNISCDILACSWNKEDLEEDTFCGRINKDSLFIGKKVKQMIGGLNLYRNQYKEHYQIDITSFLSEKEINDLKDLIEKELREDFKDYDNYADFWNRPNKLRVKQHEDYAKKQNDKGK